MRAVAFLMLKNLKYKFYDRHQGYNSLTNPESGLSLILVKCRSFRDFGRYNKKQEEKK